MRTYRTDHRNPQRLRYGWRLTLAGQIVVDPRQRASIFLMLALRNEQATLQQICDYLSHLQRPTPRKGRWHCSTVKKIIDQNRALVSLLPRALPAHGVPAPLPLAPAERDAGNPTKPDCANAQERTAITARDPVYAPTRRRHSGALVHKSGPRSLARG